MGLFMDLESSPDLQGSRADETSFHLARWITSCILFCRNTFGSWEPSGKHRKAFANHGERPSSAMIRVFSSDTFGIHDYFLQSDAYFGSSPVEPISPWHHAIPRHSDREAAGALPRGRLSSSGNGHHGSQREGSQAWRRQGRSPSGRAKK